MRPRPRAGTAGNFCDASDASDAFGNSSESFGNSFDAFGNILGVVLDVVDMLDALDLLDEVTDVDPYSLGDVLGLGGLAGFGKEYAVELIAWVSTGFTNLRLGRTVGIGRDFLGRGGGFITLGVTLTISVWVILTVGIDCIGWWQS